MTLRVDVFTIFPGMVEAYAGESILGRAGVAGHLDVRAHDLRLASQLADTVVLLVDGRVVHRAQAPLPNADELDEITRNHVRAPS